MSDIKSIIFLLFFVISNFVQAENTVDRYDPDCLPLFVQGRHGPFNYETTSLVERQRVERVHFDENYQAYRLGKKSFKKKHDAIIETPAAGFDYTLWAFPNHLLALAAVEDISMQQKTDKPLGAKLRVHCYFQRAVKFVPNDPMIRSLYGYYYARRGKVAEAKEQLEIAKSIGDLSLGVAVYLAFSYIEINDYDKALESAKSAYELGYSLPGLRNRLEKMGKWKE